MRTALSDLQLDKLIVLYPGDKNYALAERIEVSPITQLAEPYKFQEILDTKNKRPMRTDFQSVFSKIRRRIHSVA